MPTFRLTLLACWALMTAACSDDTTADADGSASTPGCDEVVVPSDGSEENPVLQDVVACVVDDSILFRAAVQWDAPPAGGTVRLNVNGIAVEPGASGAAAVAAVYETGAATGELRVLDLTTFLQIESEPTEGSADDASMLVHMPHTISGQTLSAVVNSRSFAFSSLGVQVSVRDAGGSVVSELERSIDLPALLTALAP